jgi:regulator of replication initiation timing
MDQLERLNKNNDDHDQLIHDLRSELSSLKGLNSQVEALKEENSALKREVEGLRRQGQPVQSPKIEGNAESVPAENSDSGSGGTDHNIAMTKEEAKDLIEVWCLCLCFGDDLTHGSSSFAD